jgi:hypothetical protein
VNAGDFAEWDPLILQSKQDQASHEYDDAEELIFSEPFMVHHHAKHHADKSITGVALRKLSPGAE